MNHADNLFYAANAFASVGTLLLFIGLGIAYNNDHTSRSNGNEAVKDAIGIVSTSGFDRSMTDIVKQGVISGKLGNEKSMLPTIANVKINTLDELVYSLYARAFAVDKSDSKEKANLLLTCYTTISKTVTDVTRGLAELKFNQKGGNENTGIDPLRDQVHKSIAHFEVIKKVGKDKAVPELSDQYTTPSAGGMLTGKGTTDLMEKAGIVNAGDTAQAVMAVFFHLTKSTAQSVSHLSVFDQLSSTDDEKVFDHTKKYILESLKFYKDLSTYLIGIQLEELLTAVEKYSKTTAVKALQARAKEGFTQAIDNLRTLKPDFMEPDASPAPSKKVAGEAALGEKGDGDEGANE